MQTDPRTGGGGGNSSNQYFFKPHVPPLPHTPTPPPHHIPYFPPLFASKLQCPFSFLKTCHWGFSFSSFPSLNNMLLKPVRGQSKAGGGTMAVRASGRGPLCPPLPVSQQGEKGVHIRKAAGREDSVPAGDSLACGGRVWVGWGGHPCKGQPVVKYQSPDWVEDIPPWVRGWKWNRRLGT